MKFAEWSLTYHLMRREQKMGAHEMKVSDWYAFWNPMFQSLSATGVPEGTDNPGSPASAKLRFDIESKWLGLGLPYYSVYPVIAQPLLRVNLEMEPKWLKLDVSPILVRFNEPIEVEHDKISAILVSVESANLSVVIQSIDDTGQFYASFMTETQSAESLEQLFNELVVDSDARSQSLCRAAMRIAAGVSLLARDKDIVEPELLASDTGKPLSERLIDRAKKRGVYGWSIGKHLATGPHLRRPHFAIRWMGKGRTEPRLRPVKGCLVNRQTLTKVPTGFLADDQAIE